MIDLSARLRSQELLSYMLELWPKHIPTDAESEMYLDEFLHKNTDAMRTALMESRKSCRYHNPPLPDIRREYSTALGVFRAEAPDAEEARLAEERHRENCASDRRRAMQLLAKLDVEDLRAIRDQAIERYSKAFDIVKYRDSEDPFEWSSTFAHACLHVGFEWEAVEA